MNLPLPNASASPWLAISDYQRPAGWTAPNAAERAREYCEQLEHGEILFFPGIPFEFPQADFEFLLNQRRGDSRLHKNISYRPIQRVLRGSEATGEDLARLRGIMLLYSARVTGFVSRFLLPYAGKWTLDYASFRPLEEEGRALPLHKRNDLLHVDAFPSRPTFGARILRVFTNISPKPRVWVTGHRFTALAQRYAASAGLSTYASHREGGVVRGAKQALKALGLPVVVRSPYDRFMLHFHDWLKENSEFQHDPANVVLSLFPFVVLLLTLARSVFPSPAMEQVIVDMLREYLPASQNFVIRNINALVSARKGVQVASLIMLLITSTGVFLPLEVAL